MRAGLCVSSLFLALLLAYSMGLAVLLMWTQGAFSPSRRWANKDAAAAVAGAAFLLDPCESASPRRSNATAAWYRTQQLLARGWSPSASSSPLAAAPAGTALHPMPPPLSPRAPTEAAAPRAVRHVYIHTTWRSGSSFVGELLNQHPAVFYMFEPLWHLWRAFPDRGALELQPKAVELLRDLFQCRLSRAFSPLIHGRDDARLLFGWQRNKVMCSQALCPMPTSGGSGGSRHGAVPRSGAACGRRCPRVSLRQLEEQCRRFGVVAVKDVRLLELHALRPLLLEEQDAGDEEDGGVLDVRVVHLLRDPRAVAASRQRVRRALARDSAQLARSLLLPRRYNATTSTVVVAAAAAAGGGGAGVGAGAAGAADPFAAVGGAADDNFAGVGAAGAAGEDHFAGLDGDVAAARAAAGGGGNHHYARPAQQQQKVPYQNPPPPPPLSRVDFTGNLMEVLCRSSAQGVQQGILEPWLRHRYLLLRYEDFLTDPERSLSSLYTFAGLPPSPDASALLNALVEAPSPKGDGPEVRLPSRARPRPAFAVSPRDANVSLSGWRRTLSAERVRVVQALCREVMSVVGYPLSCPASRGNFLWI
ncbi:carbohydrate sulfotransferase 7-like [Petromyzon marinus]|uniref:carbohydrate sulfotransferase 7-like n=1 Tax=Petromyzon marinus TaxID=7757 RepID=UPI003F70A6E3